MRKGRSKDDGATGCLVFAFLTLFMMPVTGLVMVCSKDSEKKTLGWILLVVGTIFWIIIGVGSA
jgi:hypothetical protein